jgi:hypothetical protein
MRAEVERAYQAGGLAAVVGAGPEEEEDTAAPLLTVDEIVERTTNPRAGQSLTSMMIIQNKDQALERLRSGREDITARRAERRRSQEQEKWLAFGQAMLTPTRTGGIGESIGMGAGALREESAKRAASEEQYDQQLDMLASQEIAAEAQAIDQLLTEAGHANAAKGIHGAIQTMVHQDDRGLPVEQQRIVFGSMQLVDGEWKMAMVLDGNGDAFEAADRLDPARAAALIAATERAKSQTGRSEEFIATAYGYVAPIDNIRRANQLFEGIDPEISTSGVTVLRNRLANIFGVDLGDTVELTELQMIVADHYLSRLEALKGNTSDRDIQEMKGISVGLGQNATANYRILKRMEAVYSTAIRNGIREAYQSKDMDAVSDLWRSADGNVFFKDAPFIKNEDDYNNLAPDTWFYMEGEWGERRYHKPAQEDEAAAEEEG